MVIDTSALLAVLFDEPDAAWVARKLNEEAGELKMSTVNLAEALILLRDRQPGKADALEAQLLASGIEFVPPDVEQARLAAAARLAYPLNLGDCFAYALAATGHCAILTLDRDFAKTDARCVMPRARSRS